MDDCYSKETQISSITGLLVPLNVYADTRSRFYQVTPRIESLLPDGRKFNDIRPPELHSSEFLKELPNADDNLRFHTWEAIVELVLSQELEVYRCGYYITKKVRKWVSGFGTDDKLRDLCWASLISMLEMKLEQEVIIPVMDSLSKPIAKTFSQLVQTMDQMRAAGWESIMSIKHSENILGEVFYCDSKYSIFIQVADTISYLRHVTDMASKGMELTEFKKRLSTISEKLSPAIKKEEVTILKIGE